MDAVQEWDFALRGWAVPDAILASAPQSPYGFGIGLFDRRAEEALGKQTPSRRKAREALPDGGTVLDVGCGGGAASLSLIPQIGRAIGVDHQQGMLDAFAARAERLGVAHEEVHGRWPDVAEDVADADVVVCHHVLYNAPGIAPFARALTDHARHRVVVEMTAEHPLAWMRPLWRRFHGLERPTGPLVEHAVAALRQLGLPVEAQRWDEPSPLPRSGDQLVTSVRGRLCLPEDRDPEVEAALRDLDLPPERWPLATLWWPGGARTTRAV